MRDNQRLSGTELKFDDWIGGRALPFLSTNAGAPVLPFQGWRRFKEAFAPEIIAETVRASPIPVESCLDPFGGSGTTALACQFLGVHPVTIEVNPYLCDLMKAKLSSYSIDKLRSDFIAVQRTVAKPKNAETLKSFPGPRTLVEPGKGGSFVLPRVVANRLLQYRTAIQAIQRAKHRRLFLVLLGGVVVAVSNVVISGKGRRYRRNWQERMNSSKDVDVLWSAAVEMAIRDISDFANRKTKAFNVIHGDCRRLIKRSGKHQLAVFSPPYPNSFDYTDVYNLELWTLGYLRSYSENYRLRKRTLCSHVQIHRHFGTTRAECRLLLSTLSELTEIQDRLWDRRIPAMIAGYFADMEDVLCQIYQVLVPKAQAAIIVGASQYGGVTIPTAAILADLATKTGFRVAGVKPCRSMRVSPQQGGKPGLSETLILLERP